MTVAARNVPGLTVDELARHAGTTVRTVRSYHDKGLLPPPRIVRRTGYYDDGHLSRLTLIARLLEHRVGRAHA